MRTRTSRSGAALRLDKAAQNCPVGPAGPQDVDDDDAPVAFVAPRFFRGADLVVEARDFLEERELFILCEED